MKKAVLAILFCTFLVGPAAVFGANDMGMTFTFNGLDNLGVTPIRGGSIGLKNAMGPDKYLLIRAGLGHNNTTQDASVSGNSDPEQSVTTLVAGVGIQKNMATTDRVTPYLGGMVNFGWTRNKDTKSVSSNPSDGTLLEEKTSSLLFGAAAMLGFEYFIRETVSLGGDYTFGFGYSKNKTEDDFQGSGTSSVEGSGWNIGPFGTVMATMTVYFDMD